jgi:parvulin-like peptidyl-prolyl isomerase
MKIILILFSLLLCHTAIAQKIAKKLAKIQTLEQANVFITANPSLKSEILELDSEKDTLAIYKKLYQTPSKEVLRDGKERLYKIVEEKTMYAFRTSYIFLNPNRLTVPIDSLQKAIIKQYEQGTPFPVLAQTYSMDGNKENGGDLGWFKEGMMVSEFQEAIRKHKKGDIFALDLIKQGWYYVCLKTYDNKAIKNLKVLEVILPNTP